MIVSATGEWLHVYRLDCYRLKLPASRRGSLPITFHYQSQMVRFHQTDLQLTAIRRPRLPTFFAVNCTEPSLRQLLETAWAPNTLWDFRSDLEHFRVCGGGGVPASPGMVSTYVVAHTRHQLSLLEDSAS